MIFKALHTYLSFYKMGENSGVPFQDKGRNNLRSRWEGILKNDSFHFWNTSSVPSTTLCAFCAFSQHSQPPNEADGISLFQVREQRFREGT